jgi:hypothetical protein
MNALLQKATEVNKNGAINGRSLPYCNLSEYERIQLAADAVTAVHPSGSDKESSRARVLQLFPSAHALLARKMDHGRAEAALIALFAANNRGVS